jgi:hypothetical protein
VDAVGEGLMAVITLFPFNSGLATHIDPRLLPDGALADAVNVELDRQGRLIGRPKYTAQAMTVFDQVGLTDPDTLVAYDLFVLNNRLFAIGDANQFGYYVDVYEYLPSGLVARWRPTSPINQLFPRMPRATRVRDIARPADVVGGVVNMGCAAGGGFAALVWNSDDIFQPGFVHIVSAALNQTVVFTSANAAGLFKKLRAVALSDRFLFLSLNTLGTAISLARWIFATDQGLTTVSSSIMSGGAITIYAACKVAGSDQFCVVADVAGTITLKRYSNTGANQAPSGGAYATVSAVPTALAVEASSTANQITVAMVVGGEARLFSYNLTTGAAIGAGPFVPFSGETSVEVGLVRLAADGLEVVSSVTSETAPTVFTRRYVVSTNAFGPSIKAVTDAQLTASPVAVDDGGSFFGIRVGLGTVGNTPNMLVSHAKNSADEVTPEIVKDLETAGTTSQLLPDITLDSSTGKYYWTVAVANPDGDLTPLLTEFELTSTARRQTAQYANTVYIAGGVPLAFDGLSLVESGFLTRPRIISLTPSNGAGELAAGGTYRYRCHWEWTDSEGDLHLSPPSAITSVDLNNTHDTVTAVVSSPHSMRRNRGSTGAVRCVLSRTLGTVDLSPATLLGSALLTPPSGVLTGLTLKLIVITPSITNYTVTFSAAAITAAIVASEINTITSSKITATVDGDQIRLTSVAEGDTTILGVISNGTANAILGFSTGASDTDRGNTTITVGENFQRTATASTDDLAIPVSPTPVGSYVTVVDLRKDQSDPILDSDLIRQQVLYSQGTASGAHHSPPPSECLWAGRERVITSKQPKRSRSTASKLIVPAEPAEFAAEGFLAFSGSVAGDIEASAMLGDTMVHFTRRQVWFVTGAGPDRSGQGSFFAAQLITKTIGLATPDGWRSLCEDDAGLWFQGSDKQIYRLSKGGGIEWLGKEVQDKLLLYPIVTASLYIPSKREVAFSITSADGLTGGIIRYREERAAWFFDDVGAVTSMADYQGRIAMVQGGVVLIQDAVPGVGTSVPYYVTTGMFQGFQGLGYGALQQVGVLGTYRGPFTLEIRKSINGSAFPVSLGSWVVTGADYAVGDRVVKLVTPAVMTHDQFALQYLVTPTADSEGLWLHAAAIETDKQPGFTRLGARHNL